MPETPCSRRYDWFDRLVELHLADVAARAAERVADLEKRAEERAADQKERAAERVADLALRAEEREADRREAGVRAWKVALVLPVEVVLLFAGAVAILEWLRA